jgi:tetratricopeptide (TPR) repeat protein
MAMLSPVLLQAGRVKGVIGDFEQALRIKPDLADAHYKLGIALEETGRVTEAIEHDKQAVKPRPDLTAARNVLARV